MKKYFILTAAVAMFAACTNDTAPGQDIAQGERIPLTIGYSLGNLNSPSITRGNFDNVQNTNILNGDGTTSAKPKNTIGLFVLKKSATSASQTYERINFPSTSLASGNPTTNYTLVEVNSSSSVNNDILLYPEDKTQEIDIYAYAPYISNSTDGTKSNVPTNFGAKDGTTKLYGGNISSDKITFFTETNQTTEENYMKSDILWGAAGTGTTITAAVSGVDGGSNPTGAYNKLGKTGLNNNNEISAQQYLIVKKNETITTPISYTALSASGPTGAYYLTYDNVGPNKDNTADVVVPMLHRGSKIVVKLKVSGMELTKLQNAEVRFYVDHLQGELNVSTGELVAASGETPTRQAVILTDKLGIADVVSNISDAPTLKGTEGTDTYVCSAVIIPQENSVANGDNPSASPSPLYGQNNLIEIDLYSDNRTKDTSGGAGTYATTTATYGYKTGAAAITFESGKVYTYTITVKASGLSVTTTVQDWVDATSGTPISGNAELQ